MQFAKVGLTVIAGIAGLISNASIHDTPFLECLILLLAISSASLCKLFYRGSRVVRVGTVFIPHSDSHVKPDTEDVFETQAAATFLAALKTHVSRMAVYYKHTPRADLSDERQSFFSRFARMETPFQLFCPCQMAL
jgi:hypothetical protein